MTNALLGDPASMSALGASLRRTAVRLAEDAERLADASAQASPGWSGPRAAGLRRRVDTVTTHTDGVAAALDDVGRALQLAATDLATAIAQLRELEASASGLGLQVRDGSVTRGWGITGVADAGAVRAGDEQRQRLQVRVHQTVTTLGRQRARLAKDLDKASVLLTRAAAELRR